MLASGSGISHNVTMRSVHVGTTNVAMKFITGLQCHITGGRWFYFFQ